MSKARGLADLGNVYVALPDYDQDKPDVLLSRQAWREEIRALAD